MNVICRSCGRNLYEYYFLDKTDDESKSFIIQENQRLKKESLAIELVEREERNAAEVAAYESNQTLGGRIERFFSSKVFGFGIVTFLILFSVIWIKNTTLEERKPYLNWYIEPKEKIISFFEYSIDYVTSIGDVSVYLIILLGIFILLMRAWLKRLRGNRLSLYFVLSLYSQYFLFGHFVKYLLTLLTRRKVLIVSGDPH